MKLCRFVLLQDEETVRSGIFHEGRLYETHGLTAVGTHELSKVRMLPPVARPPSLRFFDPAPANAPWRIQYAYRNPAVILSTGAEIILPAGVESVDFEVRVAAVMGESREHVAPGDGQRLILGYAPLVALVDVECSALEREAGLCPVRSRDFPVVLGALLTTAEELDAFADFDLPVGYRWQMSAKAGDVLVCDKLTSMPQSYEELLLAAAERMPIYQGEVLAARVFPKPPLPETLLGRYLRPGDSLQVWVEGLGNVACSLA